MGYDSCPYYVVGLFKYFEKNNQGERFLKDILPKMKIPSDNLHCIKGWIARLIYRLIKCNRMDAIMFENKMKQEIIHKKFSDCNGSDSRLLIYMFSDIIIPCIAYNKFSNEPKLADKLNIILPIFKRITWIAYTSPIAQSFIGIHLLLRHSCLEFSIHLDQFPKELKLMDLYLHFILKHFPEDFEEHSFQRGSTEDGERFIMFIKKVIRNCTNRQKEQSLKEPFLRFSNKLLFDISLAENDDNKMLKLLTVKEEKSRINKKYEEYDDEIAKLDDIQIDIPTNEDNSDAAKSKRCFIKLIKEKYNNKYWTESNNTFILHTKEDIQAYFKVK